MARQYLTGSWELSTVGHGVDAPLVQPLPMTIPGDIHSALLKGNVIPDPYYAFNERDVQWVGKQDWKIERKFNFKIEDGRTTYLYMDMVDTFFSVLINGKDAGHGSNYFRLWRFDVTDALIDGENTVEVFFESSERHAIERAAKLPYPVPVTTYDMFSPHRNLVRKIQCQSGWDWGPCLMVSGIYGTIYLDTVKEGYIEAVTAETIPQSKTEWNVDVEIHYHAEHDTESSSSVTIELIRQDGITLACKTAKLNVHAGANIIRGVLSVQNPELWKCADELKECGKKQNTLYTLRCIVKTEDGAEDSLMEKGIAFRTLTLEAVPDEKGCSLFFNLNGRPIFAKGANWVPVDSLPSRWTASRYLYLLQSAVDANMNSLRFWGGGQYESDLCYDLCDKLGIIVWQDCMFACSLYPTNEEFLADVEAEIKDNVLRLQSHPSLAVWCGNNENFGALNWYEESRKNRDRYIVDYDRLNHDTVEKTVRKWDKGHTWWPSSPCSGPNNFGDNWHDDSEGDMHFWSVWHEKKDMEAYLSIKPRFVSEFGYESFPSMSGIREYAPEGEENLTSPVMEWHQRSPSGNSIILENMSRYFRFPTSTENMVYLSQVQQAIALKTAVDYWRSLRPRCMGAMYWQLNDVWPVASWSSIEHSGKWKLLHYAARRFFAPNSFSLIKKDDAIYAYIINDTSKSLVYDATISFIAMDGKNVAKDVHLSGKLARDSAKCIWESPIKDLVKTEDSFIYGTAVFGEDGNKSVAHDTLFVNRWKRYDLPVPHFKVEVAEDGTKIQVTVSSDKAAFYTALDAQDVAGRFSDNMFTVLPDTPATVVFIPDTYGLPCPPGKKAKTLKEIANELAASITIKSLRDSYSFFMN